MMGIPVEAPAHIHRDNQSVLANTTIPDSAQRKKLQSITYHFICEGAVRDEWCMAYVNTHDNEADLLTKLLPSGNKCKGFVQIYGTTFFSLKMRASWQLQSGLHYWNHFKLFHWQGGCNKVHEPPAYMRQMCKSKIMR